MTRLIINIKPQTYVKFFSGKGGDQVLFNIPEVCTKGEGSEPCFDYRMTGLCKHTLTHDSRLRKRRIERYRKYRVDLFHLVKQAEFQLPSCGMALYFYFPFPKRWTKAKRRLMHGQLHLSQPDYDNCLKAFSDALAVSDHQVAQISGAGKFWFDPDLVPEERRQGYIEILTGQPVYNPFDVLQFVDGDRKLQMSDLERRKEEKQALAQAQKEARKEKKKQEKEDPQRDKRHFKKLHAKTDELK